MPDAAIAPDFTKSGNVLVHLTTQLSFDNVIVIKEDGKPRQVVFAKVPGFQGRLNTRLPAKITGDCRTDAVKVCQRNDDLAVVRYINT